MAKNDLVSIYCFDREIGRLGFDKQRGASFFQYNEQFLLSGAYRQLFPLIIKRTVQTQVFKRYSNETFRGLPPMIADSLPDLFGNIIFKTWMENAGRRTNEISVLEQLAYVGNRGMGALEYRPGRQSMSCDTINIEEIAVVVQQVLDQKEQAGGSQLDHDALLNIFRMGTSAGGMRPKILVSENKLTGAIVPGDVVYDNDHHHYLVKLGIDDDSSYSKELVEYTYYLAATRAGIEMMESKLISNRHFATLRYDRQGGRKIHALTATGITGFDHLDPGVSSYENLFELLLFLKCPHKDVEQLFRRMVFNLVFANHDDHLKNHSVLYNETTDSWQLAPAYDVTYSLNPELNIKTRSRALSVNGKRTGIAIDDIKAIAEQYTVKNYKSVIADVQGTTAYWKDAAGNTGVPGRIIERIAQNFTTFMQT